MSDAVERAEVAFRAYRRVAAAARAHFLRASGDEILALGSELIERGHADTSLPVARLENVRGRTVNQLRPSGGG